MSIQSCAIDCILHFFPCNLAHIGIQFNAIQLQPAYKNLEFKNLLGKIVYLDPFYIRTCFSLQFWNIQASTEYTHFIEQALPVRKMYKLRKWLK